MLLIGQSGSPKVRDVPAIYESGGEPDDLLNLHALRVQVQVADLHVLDHAVAKRAHRLLLCEMNSAKWRRCIVPRESRQAVGFVAGSRGQDAPQPEQGTVIPKNSEQEPCFPGPGCRDLGIAVSRDLAADAKEYQHVGNQHLVQVSQVSPT
jgi:hypothetical protein